MNNGQAGEVFSVMWICASYTVEKFHDSRPDLRLDVPILAQGLPAYGGPARRLYGGLTGHLFYPPVVWRIGGMF